MGRLLLGLVLGLLLSLPTAPAFRLSSPPTVSEWNQSTITQLNDYLESLQQVVNGRYTMDVTTTNPNGSRAGTQGDTVFYSNGGSYKFCVNTSATTPQTPTGLIWRCNPNSFTDT